jgi:hypothetical protein
VAVNVRIAKVRELPDRRIYDLRYIVNRAGTFDLKDYLVADDGSSLEGSARVPFEGDAEALEEPRHAHSGDRRDPLSMWVDATMKRWRC